LLTKKSTLEEWLEDHFILLTWAPDLESQPWKRSFVDNVRKAIHYFPVSRAEIIFEDDVHSFALGIVSRDNPSFAYEYYELERRLQEKLLDSQSSKQIFLRSMQGGVFAYIPKPRGWESQQSDYESTATNNDDQEYAFGGQQIIFQVRRNTLQDDTSFKLDLNTVLQILLGALERMGIDLRKIKSDQLTIQKGGIVTVLLETGNIISSWDGGRHVTVNCFSFEQGVFDQLEEEVLIASKGFLDTITYDHQPRGRNVIHYLSQ
jgi:hypothetical protein